MTKYRQMELEKEIYGIKNKKKFFAFYKEGRLTIIGYFLRSLFALLQVSYSVDLTK